MGGIPKKNRALKAHPLATPGRSKPDVIRINAGNSDLD